MVNAKKAKKNTNFTGDREVTAGAVAVVVITHHKNPKSIGLR